MSQKSSLLELVKNRLGILSSTRNDFIQAIIDSVVSELNSVHGIDETELEDDMTSTYQMFVTDLASWRYQNEGLQILPPYLRLRLNNLILRQAANDEQKSD